MTKDIDGEEKERIIKYMEVLPRDRVDPKIPGNMEVLYASIRSWGTEEEDNTPLPYCKGVDEYQ